MFTRAYSVRMSCIVVHDDVGFSRIEIFNKREDFLEINGVDRAAMLIGILCFYYSCKFPANFAGMCVAARRRH
jgi:hypothetical protein